MTARGLMGLAVAAAGMVWAQTDDAFCAGCHEAQAKSVAQTPHAAPGCTGCHSGHETVPHPENLPKPACADCHAAETEGHRKGVHGRAAAAGNAGAPDCQICHGDAHSVERTGTGEFRKKIPSTCGMCHSQEAEDFNVSVHGTAAAQGVVAAPVCSACHGAHEIANAEAADSPVSPRRIPETCGQCHGNVGLARRFQMPANVAQSFAQSFHGLALRGGRQTVANCASCHGAHKILPSSDPRSMVNAKNLPKTCGRCHPGAGARFAITTVHWVEGGGEPAAVRWVRVAYAILIPLVVGFMLLHSGGDWVRKIWTMRLKPSRPEVPLRTPPRGPATFRMYATERIQHGLLVLSFVTLAWSGFALRYPDQWWARPLFPSEAAWNVRGTVHRTAAGVFLALSVMHVITLIASRRLRVHWKSLFPVRRDVPEAILNFAYSLGLLRRKPPLSSHSYIEKVEYWALVWGAAAMSATGLLLWANSLVLRFSSKLALDMAGAVHFYEAILATLAIVIWHFYYVIFDPLVYPVDPAFLTGYSVRLRAPAGDEEKEQAE